MIRILISIAVIIMLTVPAASANKKVSEYKDWLDSLKTNQKNQVLEFTPPFITKGNNKDCLYVYNKLDGNGNEMKERCKKRPGAKAKRPHPFIACTISSACGFNSAGPLTYAWCPKTTKFEVDIYYGPAGVYYLDTIDQACNDPNKPTNCSC